MKEMKEKRIRRGKNKKAIRAMALTQISLLMLEIFAFAFLLSMIFNIEGVGAVGSGPDGGAAASAGFTNEIGFKSEFFGLNLQSNDFMWGSLSQGLGWSLYVGTIMSLAMMLFSEKKELIRAGGMALMAGIMAGQLTRGLLLEFPETTSFLKLGEKGLWSAGGVGVIVGAVVAYLVFAMLNKDLKTKEQTIEFKCMNWQAPIGGEDCNKCNGNAQQPCSEYRCKSLGQTCKLLNAGTGQEKCVDSSPNDVTSPGIKPWPDALTIGYKYANVQERPPGNANVPGHMQIIDPNTKDGCLKAFTPFQFGIITTDTGEVTQPAQCKIEFNHTKDFNSMAYFMAENNLYVENHSQVMSLPGTNLLKTLYKDTNGTLPIANDGEYTFYIRCRDGNDNQNRDEFAVKFCIDKGPDMSVPIIKATSIPTGSPVLYNADNVSLEVYTNEPSNCKWSRQDTEYETMENAMSCKNNVWEMNAELLYICKTTLTGIKDKQANDFYFRCQDTSENKNTMQESYNFQLKGSQPLTVIEVSPNGTIGSSTSTALVNLQVKTDNGEDNGKSRCLYSLNNNSGFIEMFETNSNIHKQPLDLPAGDYKYYFKCIDLGGNTALNYTEFSVFVDTFSPAVVRTYSLESKLIIVTDEDSSCKYSTTSCNFDLSKEGIVMQDLSSSSAKIHYAEWKADQSYYIKCSDSFNNQPDPTQCSIILKPYNQKAD